jgi:tellurite resistance protein TehA-like permease
MVVKHFKKTNDNILIKKISLIILALVWLSALNILIIALTNVYPNTVFSKHRSIVVIAFIAITGFLKPIYNSVISKANSLE